MNTQTTVTFRVLPDLNPDASYLEQEGFEDRRAQYLADLFSFVGIRAEVQLHDWTTGVVTNVTSAGLWNIEDDSDREYLWQVGSEELDSLSDELAARGIDISGIEPVLE